MVIEQFPPLDQADENGLLAFGGDLKVESLILAYQRGIFPWPISKDAPLAWFSPHPRGILNFKDLHVNKRLKRYLRKSSFFLTCNQEFENIIRSCAQVPRLNQKNTWITNPMIQAYINLFQQEMAYSLEVWDEKRNLVGGLYGVCLSGIISGESMFHLQDHASKFALISLMNILKEANITWIDTQMVTPILKSLGGTEIPRDDFIKKLIKLKKNPLKTRDQIFPSEINQEDFKMRII